MKTDTIAAIATAMTSSGIGIIRISGGQAFEVIEKIFKKKNGGKIDLSRSHTVQYGYICDQDEVIDEVLVLIMKGPHTYTGEDTVEIDCHGGVYVMKRILETVIRHGARPAEPGEFTKRAFLNGRIDLSQAESVIDVIYSKNDFALKSSLSQLSVNGEDLIRLGYPEGKGIGKALNRLLQLVLDETLENQKELLLKKAKSWMKLDCWQQK